MSLAAYFHPGAFYVLPVLLVECGPIDHDWDDCVRTDSDETCITLGWFVWTVEVWP